MNEPERTRSSMFRRLRAGDEQEWVDFDRSYRLWLIRLAHSRGLDNQAAEELASEVIIVLYNRLPNWEYDRDKGGLRAWLRVCINNAVSNYWRTQNRQVDSSSQLVELAGDPEALESLLDVLVRAEEERRRSDNLQIAIMKVRSQGNEMQWQSWHLTEKEGLSVDEAAERLQTTPGNIYTLKCRFKSLIDDIMRKLGDDDDRR